MRCHFTPIRIAIPKNKTENKKCCQECGEIGSLGCSVLGNAKWYSCYGDKYGVSSKNKKNRSTTYGPTIPLLHIFPKELKAKS